MTQTAGLIWNSVSRANYTVPRGISTDSRELSKSRARSIEGFRGLSEFLRRHSPGFIGDAEEALNDTLAKVHDLLSWGENWNSYRALAPSPIAVAYAESWVVNLFQTVEELGLLWIKPSVTPSPEGEVVFEWWYGEKKLTMYVGDQSIDYVQVWGTDIHAKITDGDIGSISDCRSLWVWLTS